MEIRNYNYYLVLLIFWSVVCPLTYSARASDFDKCIKEFDPSHENQNNSDIIPTNLTEIKNLENKMTKIIKLDPNLERLVNEANYYKYMEEYAFHLQRIDTVKSLISEGILELRNGEFVSNYTLSYTHLGVLQLSIQKDGTFNIVQNRGTLYFRGVNNPAFGGHSALDYIKSEQGKSIYPNIIVIIAIPRSEVEKIGIDPTNRELHLDRSIFTELKGIRIFKTKVSAYDLAIYENNVKWSE